MKKLILMTVILATYQSSFASTASGICRTKELQRTQKSLINAISSSEALSIQAGTSDVSAISIESISDDKLNALMTVTFDNSAEKNTIVYKVKVNCQSKPAAIELENLGEAVK